MKLYDIVRCQQVLVSVSYKQSSYFQRNFKHVITVFTIRLLVQDVLFTYFAELLGKFSLPQSSQIYRYHCHYELLSKRLYLLTNIRNELHITVSFTWQ